jgi:hypothetical protein
MELNHSDVEERKKLEKLSSAFTLSDMEIFIFPELFYPLVLSNIMSPLIWEWRKDPWFSDIEKKSFNYKVNRIKQFIIQNYVFNLDLATWGLTTKSRELERFRDFFDMELLKQSNALFGYEGDKYYFDIDIRKHFGLDKYNSEVIPYWKTETVEAMTAFRYRENFVSGAGECVSLSALYAAAMFIIGRIPLEKIFLIATPLHSQNFIMEKEGLITNNRRIVTKNMWFNGTSLSEKARRALENEKVTIVSHISGHIHTIYTEASINNQAYNTFEKNLRSFLISDLNSTIFINFLRFKSKYKSMFQFECECSGRMRYISLEKIFEYEHNSKFHLSDDTREKLLCEIEGDEFHLSPLPGKMLLNDAERFLNNGGSNTELQNFEAYLKSVRGDIGEDLISAMIEELNTFICTEPKLPETNKTFISQPYPSISPDHSREDIRDLILGSAEESELSMLTLYVYRDMDHIDWVPFIKAAVERNPVNINELAAKTIEEVYQLLESLPGESIYEGNRLAQPDEVWNFKRGDGLEKALLFAGLIINRKKDASLEISIRGGKVQLSEGEKVFKFHTGKKADCKIAIGEGRYKVNN